MRCSFDFDRNKLLFITWSIEAKCILKDVKEMRWVSKAVTSIAREYHCRNIYALYSTRYFPRPHIIIIITQFKNNLLSKVQPIYEKVKLLFRLKKIASCIRVIFCINLSRKAWKKGRMREENGTGTPYLRMSLHTICPT